MIEYIDTRLSTIGGYIPLSGEFARELYEQKIGPWHGPSVPMPLKLWRELGGHPAGPYRRAVS